MSDTVNKFAETAQKLESELGLEAFSQYLATMLLACSARMVGDSDYNWTVNTPFVSGEVCAVTDNALDTNISTTKK